jgi:plastocyanin
MSNALRVALLGTGLYAAGAAAAATHDITIKMQKESFAPAKAAVVTGTLITWTNNDTVPHSVTAADNRFDSGAILPGKTFQWTANDSGTIAYHCIFHPSMTAVLTVRGSAKQSGR